MNDSDKTKDQLIEELTTLRRQYAEVIAKSAAEEPGEAAEACVGNQKLLDTIIEEAPT